MNTYHYSDRLLIIRTHAQPTHIYIIQVNSPTSSSSDVEIENMYEHIEDLMEGMDEKSNIIIIEDFNASVGEKDNITKCLGKFGLGSKNERGVRLINFCKQLELSISNTFFFIVPKQWKYT